MSRLRWASARLGVSSALILVLGACAERSAATEVKDQPEPATQPEGAQDKFDNVNNVYSRPAASARVGTAYGKSGVGRHYAPPSAPLQQDTGGGGAEPSRRVLNPNARYATTYRPGGAALAAFDAALQKGSIPVSYKDLVGDFAARYAPALEPVKNSALAVSFETERTALPPDGGALHLRIAFQGAEVAPTRPHLVVSLVLDRSGSMSGAAIDRAKEAAGALVDRLDPQDEFSLVTFSTNAEVLVALGNVGNRRAHIRERISTIKADGGTNISAGLDLGYAQARRKASTHANVNIVMLLSDGHANAGDTSPNGLSKRTEDAFQSGIQTSTFGLGDSFDARLMNTIADRGAGGYYYLADASQIAKALATELDSRLMPVAQGLEVRLRLRPDVTVSRVFGSRELSAADASHVRRQEVSVDHNVNTHDGIARDRQSDAEGGMRFFIPSFARGDRHAMMFELNVPKGLGERAIATVELRYKDRIVRENVAKETAIKVRFADSDAASYASLVPSVVKTVQAFAAGEAIGQAAEQLAAGDRAGAERLLRERSELLVTAAERFSDGAFREDAVRLSRLATAVREAKVEPIALALLLRSSARGYLQ
jgi:Ca-activated chloride channel family protein